MGDNIAIATRVSLSKEDHTRLTLFKARSFRLGKPTDYSRKLFLYCLEIGVLLEKDLGACEEFALTWTQLFFFGRIAVRVGVETVAVVLNFFSLLLWAAVIKNV